MRAWSGLHPKTRRIGDATDAKGTCGAGHSSPGGGGQTAQARPASRRSSGYGGAGRAMQISISSGKPTAAGSTSNIRSASSSKPSGGLRPGSAPRQADRWTWLVLLAYAQLRLARHRRRPELPWERPQRPRLLTRPACGVSRHSWRAWALKRSLRSRAAGPPGVRKQSPGPAQRHPALKTAA